MNDLAWLIEHDQHMDSKTLGSKIANNEIYIIQENRNLGWLRYGLFWDTTPFLNMLFIEDKLRHKGLGKKLVTRWENDMRMSGFKLVLVSTQSNEDSQKFYRKLGYKDIGGFVLPNEPLEILLMKKLG